MSVPETSPRAVLKRERSAAVHKPAISEEEADVIVEEFDITNVDFLLVYWVADAPRRANNYEGGCQALILPVPYHPCAERLPN